MQSVAKLHLSPQMVLRISLSKHFFFALCNKPGVFLFDSLHLIMHLKTFTREGPCRVLWICIVKLQSSNICTLRANLKVSSKKMMLFLEMYYMPGVVA